MTDDRDAERAARRAETEAMVEAEAAQAKEVLTKRAEQKAQAVTTEVICSHAAGQRGRRAVIERTRQEFPRANCARVIT
jgi:hypothetical protein